MTRKPTKTLAKRRTECQHDFQTRLKHIRINQIVDALQDAMMGSENHESTNEAFFMTSPVSRFRQDFRRLPDIPESLNRNIRYLYTIIGNSRVEVNLRKKRENQFAQDWTIMSLNESLRRYKDLVKQGQTRVFDIAFTYAGLGHIRLLCCDLTTHNLFYRMDGGSNGWEREDNKKQLLTLVPSVADQFTFIEWFRHFL